MIPHKLRKWWALFDLNFPVEMMELQYIFNAVNAATKKTTPPRAIEQLRQVLPRIIETITESRYDEIVFMAKEDIKCGLWRMVTE